MIHSGDVVSVLNPPEVEDLLHKFSAEGSLAAPGKTSCAIEIDCSKRLCVVDGESAEGSLAALGKTSCAIEIGCSKRLCVVDGESAEGSLAALGKTSQRTLKN